MTVSRVINHPQLVREELRASVYQAMKELDYRPNAAAKALASNRSMVVKVLILEKMDITEPYYMHLLNGIAQELDVYQYSLQLLTQNSVDLGISDGYIITGMKEADFEWIKSIDRPLILFGENAHGLPFIDSDNEEGMATVTQYAIECGYEQVIFIGIDVPEQFEQSREAGYQRVMEKNPHIKDELIRIPNSSSLAEQLISKELDLKPNTCFVCASDRIAIGVERGIQSLQLDIPNDYGVTGFDSVFLDQIASPKLTTVKQDIVHMGRMLVQQLMKLIQGEELKEPQLYFDTELIVRDTTK